jgi:hypothetical protein
MGQAVLCFSNHKLMLATGLLAISQLLCCPVFAGEQKGEELKPLPPGITLPVSLDRTLDQKHLHQGESIVASLYQRVPLAHGVYLSKKAKLLGTAVSSDGKTLELRWTEVRLGHQSVPIAVKLLAAAQWMDVAGTNVPLGGTDRGTSSPADWTTMQIGGDEVYRSGGSGAVYNHFSDRVGDADLFGVYAAPQSAGALPRAMGPFSTTSAGLYDLQWMVLASPGGAGHPIVFGLENHRWQLHAADALLLEVVQSPSSAQ